MNNSKRCFDRAIVSNLLKMFHYNGRLVEEKEVMLTPSNRSFMYGDGLFETMVMEDDDVKYWTDHFDRMSRGCEALKISLPQHDWLKDISELARTREGKRKRIKWQVWRKEGGLVTPLHNDAEWLISVQEFTPAPVLKKKAIYSEIVLAFNSFSKYKTAQFLPYIQAALLRKEKGADEVILFGPENCLAEAGVGNIFWVKGDHVYTPSLECGCIEGIMRRQIITYLNARNITVREGIYTPRDLMDAEALFSSNVSGISFLEELEHMKFYTDNSLVKDLQDRFNYR